MATEPQDKASSGLSFTLEPAQLGEFYHLLQDGFFVPVRVGCSVTELLCGQFGIAGEYVHGRITTVFLNGKAIDDLNAAIVRDGARLTLSAAMPGLVGATMRRGGFYAAMRGAMTYRESDEEGPAGRGTIRMKLFNLLLPELGPAFLGRGIGVTAAVLTDFFMQRHPAFWQECREILLDGAPLAPERLRGGDALAGTETVRVTVSFRDMTALL